MLYENLRSDSTEKGSSAQQSHSSLAAKKNRLRAQRALSIRSDLKPNVSHNWSSTRANPYFNMMQQKQNHLRQSSGEGNIPTRVSIGGRNSELKIQRFRHPVGLTPGVIASKKVSFDAIQTEGSDYLQQIPASRSEIRLKQESLRHSQMLRGSLQDVMSYKNRQHSNLAYSNVHLAPLQAISVVEQQEIEYTQPTIQLSDVRLREKLAPNENLSNHKKSRVFVPLSNSIDDGTDVPSTLDQTIRRVIQDSTSGAHDEVSQIYGMSEESVPQLQPQSPVTELGEPMPP